MEVIPAVDVLAGEAVRLYRGDYGGVLARAGDPVALARRFADAGARRIHAVDLDGARRGRVAPDLVAALAAAAAPAGLQASGGIRSVDDARRLVAAGAERVVVGTAAFASPDAARMFATALGKALVVALDVRGGRVAVRGWLDDTGLAVEDAADRCARAGVPRLLCTAIERDGTLEGPDVGLLERVRDASGLPVLAAGGMASEADLDAVAAVGCEAAIVGRALLEGAIPLAALAA